MKIKSYVRGARTDVANRQRVLTVERVGRDEWVVQYSTPETRRMRDAPRDADSRLDAALADVAAALVGDRG
jgi:hypothetical protein